MDSRSSVRAFDLGFGPHLFLGAICVFGFPAFASGFVRKLRVSPTSAKSPPQRNLKVPVASSGAPELGKIAETPWSIFSLSK